MIEDPYIILLTARLKLGASIKAVARNLDGDPGDVVRKTGRLDRALRFPTARLAEIHARSLGPTMRAEWLATVVRIEASDMPGPKCGPVFRQTVFSEVEA